MSNGPSGMAWQGLVQRRLHRLLSHCRRSDRALRLEPDNFSIASSILPLRFFDDVVEPESETGSQLLSDTSHFSNNRIRIHGRSPTVLGA
jgi:hypothetical protein